MTEPVTFTPRSKPPTLFNIWIFPSIVCLYFLIIFWVILKTFIVGLVIDILLLPVFLSIKKELRVIIFSEEKLFNYYYMNCWGEEKTIVIDITKAEGSYKFIKIDSSKFGWQLIIFNHKKHKITISQGTFKKFQLDQMVRMINQIKKGIFVADVGTEF